MSALKISSLLQAMIKPKKILLANSSESCEKVRIGWRYIFALWCQTVPVTVKLWKQTKNGAVLMRVNKNFLQMEASKHEWRPEMEEYF